MTIGQLARRAGVHVETVRYYQRKGLMPVPDKPWGGIRHYDSAHLERLRFIRAAQQLGFSLAEIRELLRLEDGTHCAEAAEIATRKLAAVREKLQQLAGMEQALGHLLAACASGDGSRQCPLIDALKSEAHSLKGTD